MNSPHEFSKNLTDNVLRCRAATAIRFDKVAQARQKYEGMSDAELVDLSERVARELERELTEA